MGFIDTIRNTFKAKTFKYEENLSKVQVTLSTNIIIISKESILQFNELIYSADQFFISIEFEYDDVLILSKETDIDKFLEDFKDRKEIIGDDEYTLKIVIIKNVDNNSISVYDFDEFLLWLGKLNLFQQLEAFAFIFKKN
ncbi:hypothetical protein KPL37_07015 [Clostridium frigoris]|uniref:DUF4268 domain-containing protein n=1 Tax=Clostridium frigoris TaxID=205327 RepID=A0ABS6BT68_9CLOT|nr:hypothetical protein [Clostridium frigoris]MBU3159505.1 hypothetical protein [Clostridium frigoris]